MARGRATSYSRIFDRYCARVLRDGALEEVGPQVPTAAGQFARSMLCNELRDSFARHGVTRIYELPSTPEGIRATNGSMLPMRCRRGGVNMVGQSPE
jgi:hypothetical protein